jgi:hypothetical protein
MSKYEKYCIKSLDTSECPAILGNPPAFVFGKETFDEAPYHVEFTFITGNGAFMEGTDRGVDKVVFGNHDGYYDGPYPRYNMEADRILLFYGTDSKNMRDLGGTVEIVLGDGIRDEFETFKFSDPRAVFIPKGVRFGPITVSEFRKDIFVVDILTAPSLEEAKVRPDFTYFSEWHDQERLGKNGKYK